MASNSDHIKMISAFEQSAASLGVFAGMLASYHSQLCEHGFQRQEAMVLVKDLQATLFAQAFNMGTKSSDNDEDE